jgi:hypothetical protein
VASYAAYPLAAPDVRLCWVAEETMRVARNVDLFRLYHGILSE